MEEKKIVNEEEKKTETVEVTVEAKPKFGARVKGFFKRHKTKFIIAGLGAAGIAAGALVKQHKDKVREQEEADEAERTALAEEWYNRGLTAGQASLPESTESTESTTEDEATY